MAEWYDGVDCSGRTVLDLGGYSGGWGAKPALERGAISAKVVDNQEWRQYDWPEPVREHAGIVYVQGDLLEWTEPADIVIAANVIYHLRDPLAGLAHLRTLTRELLVVRTSTVLEDEADKDGWRWYPDGFGHANGTVWARPCPSGLRRSLLAAGFGDLREPDVYGGMVVVCRPA